MNSREFFGVCAVAAAAAKVPTVREVDGWESGWTEWNGTRSPYVWPLNCECCFESKLDDIADDKPERRMFRTLDESNMPVCEHCLPTLNSQRNDVDRRPSAGRR